MREELVGMWLDSWGELFAQWLEKELEEEAGAAVVRAQEEREAGVEGWSEDSGWEGEEGGADY